MKRGRASSADLGVIAFPSRVKTLEPGRDLNASEARLFREIITSLPPDYFIKSDAPMFSAYIQAACLSRQLGKRVAKEPHLAPAWERATRVMSILATKLRLTPRSRTDTKMLSRKLRNFAPGINEAIANSGVDLDDDD